MLIEFSVENFRSFRDRATLSLVATNSLHDRPELDTGNVVEVNPKLKLLRVAAIYGPNASGKSALVLAFYQFKQRILASADREEENDAAQPFWLSPNTREAPSVFEIVFWMDGAQWRYGFAVTETAVVEEWLFVARTARETKLFEREGVIVRRGSSFSEGTALLNAQGELRRPNALFLTLLFTIGAPTGTRVVEFVDNQCRAMNGLFDNGLLPFTMDCLEKRTYSEWIQGYLRRFNLGIDNFEVVYQDSDGFAVSGADAKRKSRKLHSIRRLRALQEEVSWPLEEESSGTQKLVAMAGPLADALANGKVVFADELEARLHPELTEDLVELFQSDKMNPKNAQLVFVTHDTNLLSACSFRRDQIWFVEKDRDGASRLYSLAEFRGLRREHDFEQRYLSGQFGALPFLDPPAPLMTRSYTDESRVLSETTDALQQR